jgi:hypothetical protein
VQQIKNDQVADIRITHNGGGVAFLAACRSVTTPAIV